MIPFRCNSRNMRTTALLTLSLLSVTTARSSLSVFVRADAIKACCRALEVHRFPSNWKER